jgi:hypothetical protein
MENRSTLFFHPKNYIGRVAEGSKQRLEKDMAYEIIGEGWVWGCFKGVESIDSGLKAGRLYLTSCNSP